MGELENILWKVMRKDDNGNKFLIVDNIDEKYAKSLIEL